MSINPLESYRVLNEEYKDEYMGIVKSVEDPLQIGRVRVMVLPMFDNIQTTHLPWAMPMNQVGLYVPPVNSWVVVSFINNNIYAPVYKAHFQPFSL